MILSGEPISGQFGVSDPETGGVVDADALPTAVLVVAGADSAAVVTVTRLAVGRYRFDVEAPAGLSDGDVLQVRVSAIVATVAGEGIVWAGEGGAARPPTIEDIEGATLEADSFSAAALEAIAAAVYTRIAARSAEVVSALAGDELSLHRGDLWEQPFTGLGSLAGRTRLWFTIKRNVTQDDSAAVVQITEDDGLLVVNGEAVGPDGTFSDPTLAEIVIDDEAAGDITVRIKGLVTAALSPAVGLLYDVQVLDADDQPATLTHSTLTITGDVTRAVTRPGD